MKTILALGLLVFVALAVVALPAAAAPLGDESSIEVAPTLIGTCFVGGRMANYGQTAGGVTIQPLRQWQVGDVWYRTYSVKGPVGKVLAIETTTYICAGMQRDPVSGFDQCPPSKATAKVVQVTNFVIPVGGYGTFTVSGIVGCCGIWETSISRVNGNVWAGASFFLRWAESPACTPSTTCRTGGRMANYGQTAGGVTIKPLSFSSTANSWVRTYLVTGQAGRVLNIRVVTYTCAGALKNWASGYDLCPAGQATSTAFQDFVVVIGANGQATFNVVGAAGCCSLMQSEIWTVNGNRWMGSSFFIRWAESGVCGR